MGLAGIYFSLVFASLVLAQIGVLSLLEIPHIPLRVKDGFWKDNRWRYWVLLWRFVYLLAGYFYWAFI